ncbi:MAG: type II secretion system protein N [Gammaproteobacteria bacterium]|jgi:type II secretory pathway component PulC
MINIAQVQFYLQQPRIAKGILTLLWVLLALSLLQLLKVSATSPKPPVVNEATITQTHSEVFVASPLFGISPDSGVMQATRLKLTLKGTFAATQSKTGSAVIGTANGERIYIVGDTVEGAIIQDVQPDYVVLEYQGNKEILRLPEGQRLVKTK